MGREGGARRSTGRLGRRRRWVAVAAAAIASVALGGFTVDRTAFGRSPTTGAPPALPHLGSAMALSTSDRRLDDMGDPTVVAVDGGVGGLDAPGYAVAWTTDWSANVPMAVSADLRTWRRVADALPTLPSWAAVVAPSHRWHAPEGVSIMTWAPTIRQVGDRWVLWFATEAASSGTECIGVAVADTPIGPYASDGPAPLVCQPGLGGDIDPAVVSPSPGHLALLWKSDGNSNGAPVGIWEQALSPDGLAVTGAPTRILTADRPWEQGIVEGPSMLGDSRGGWWLFFTGGSWRSATYDTGVAHCATVAGPCTSTSGPLLASTPTAVSPGGLDTFVDHQGRTWASYSAFPSTPADAEAAQRSPRVLELAPVTSR